MIHFILSTDVMKALDDTLGEVTVALKEQGMINNSIIVFLSDNGAPTTDYLDHVDNSGSNWPLRGVCLYFFYSSQQKVRFCSD